MIGTIALWVLAGVGALNVPRLLRDKVHRAHERWTATRVGSVVEGDWTIEIERETVGPDARMTISNGVEEHVYVWREYEPDEPEREGP